jgi:cell wall-associated NlpC family hydrolase
MTDRDLTIQYAWTFLGTFYSWGGDDPAGFDCSGLCNELLKAVGKIARKSDYTAQGLFDLFKNKQVEKPSAGCLSFHSDARGGIFHVEFCIDESHTIGASGGGSNTKTREDAIRDNAFVKIRPVSGTVFVDPFGE